MSNLEDVPKRANENADAYELLVKGMTLDELKAEWSKISHLGDFVGSHLYQDEKLAKLITDRWRKMTIQAATENPNEFDSWPSRPCDPKEESKFFGNIIRGD